VVGREVPLNEGCLRAVRLRLPDGSLLRPPADSAVVGGNVETSQRLVDVLLAALGVAAASQGTMNNLTFGDTGSGYYETVCGGAGAGQGRHGTDAVHTHMTNTRITDAEVLERRHPVRVLEFGLRSGSGGAGRWLGGEGVRRLLEFRAPLDVSLLSQRRSRRPFGLMGGGPGEPGRASLLRCDGTAEPLGGCFAISVLPGDRLLLETPGGGGFGEPAGQ
jgi:5-oxoprolinase (ATP-hydrolysing)